MIEIYIKIFQGEIHYAEETQKGCRIKNAGFIMTEETFDNYYLWCKYYN